MQLHFNSELCKIDKINNLNNGMIKTAAYFKKAFSVIFINCKKNPIDFNCFM